MVRVTPCSYNPSQIMLAKKATLEKTVIEHKGGSLLDVLYLCLFKDM